MAAILHGWALSQSGQKPEECIAQMRQGLADLRATGAEASPCFFALIAEVCDKANRIDEGLTVLAEGLDIVRDRGERFYEAELHRLRGELLLRCNPANVSTSGRAFERRSRSRAISRLGRSSSAPRRRSPGCGPNAASDAMRRISSPGSAAGSPKASTPSTFREARALLSELGDHGLNQSNYPNAASQHVG